MRKWQDWINVNYISQSRPRGTPESVIFQTGSESTAVILWRVQNGCPQRHNFFLNPQVLSALSEIVIKRKVVNWNLCNATDKVKGKCTEKYACNETNLMHYLSSVYSVTIPLYVSGLLVAHHQEVTMYICDSWYVLYVLRRIHTYHAVPMLFPCRSPAFPLPFPCRSPTMPFC
jgi:hypothetical protein